jgi:TolB-like protein
LASDAARDRSIAVLPLANLSGDKSDDYFGIGLAEEMTRALSKTGVRVIGRVSAGALQAKGLDERAIAKELGVGSLLTGSVQRAAGQLRINVSLIAAADGAVRWTEKYDRPIANVCAMQDEIATAVARKLLRSFGGGAARATKVETADPEAYALFLQAQALFGRRNFSTLRQAIALYGKAVARDPAYARAQASLAVALSILPSYAQVETDSIVALARAAALKAIAIDSTIPEAYTGLAVVSQTLYANRAADQYYRRSLALDSTLSTTWGWYGLLANRFGNSAEAHQRIARARELEPASLIARIWDAQVFLVERRFASADSIARVVLERDSTFQLAWDAHGEALLNLDRTDEALAALEHSVTLQRSERPTQTEGILVYVYARAGRAVDARRLIASLKQRWGGKRPAMAVIASALDLLGDHDAALEKLQRSLDEHDGWLLQYTHMNRYDRLRTDPRAAAMLAKTEAP